MYRFKLKITERIGEKGESINKKKCLTDFGEIADMAMVTDTADGFLREV